MKVEELMELVPFLGKALGDHCEIALQDCRKGCIVSIANGHISGRKVGDPLTDLAKKIIEDKEWETCDYISGYKGYTLDGKLLRSSTFFIKENGNLMGMLCINLDTSEYSRLSEIILRLGGLMAVEKPVLIGDQHITRKETFIDNVEYTISEIFNELYGDSVPDNFTQEDRLTITRQLEDRGIFMIKGAISRVADKLNCSVASMYRYLEKVRKEKDENQNM